MICAGSPPCPVEVRVWYEVNTLDLDIVIPVKHPCDDACKSFMEKLEENTLIQAKLIGAPITLSRPLEMDVPQSTVEGADIFGAETWTTTTTVRALPAKRSAACMLSVSLIS